MSALAAASTQLPVPLTASSYVVEEIADLFVRHVNNNRYPHLRRFTEMPTNRFVESSFWCFDSLFVPQQHAARDVQDTFFVKGQLKPASLPRSNGLVQACSLTRPP